MQIMSNVRQMLAFVRTFDMIYMAKLNWNPSFQFASLSSDLANRLHK